MQQPNELCATASAGSDVGGDHPLPLHPVILSEAKDLSTAYGPIHERELSYVAGAAANHA
jgi:hypothetical protein